MTAYPNPEHERADETARQQALLGLQNIIDDAKTLQRRLANRTYTDASDATSLTDKAGAVARWLTVLDTLRHVREWHEADKAEATATAPNAWDKLERDVSAATAPHRDAADVLAEVRERSEGQAEATATEARP